MLLELPWPPSTNHYWRNFRGRMVISTKGRQYRSLIGQIIAYSGNAKNLKERLAVVIRAYPPDRRKRDLDNLLKSLLDSLQHAGVYADDGQIDKLTIVRLAPEKPGKVVVTIEGLKNAA